MPVKYAKVFGITSCGYIPPELRFVPTKVPHHSMWKTLVAVVMNRRPPISAATDERQPSCFGLEEERGEDWKGSGAMKSAINESRPSL